MKSFIVVLGLLASFQASALSQNDSWETIRNTRNILTQAATVVFSAGDAVTYVPVLDICVLNEAQFMTIDAQNVIKVVREGNTTKEIVVGQERLVGSNKSTSMMKSGSSTSPIYTPIVRTTEKVQSVDVMKKDSSSSAVKLFSKMFTIPDCK